MPQIQYSEKYYDDVYEYRCAIDVAKGDEGRRTRRDARARQSVVTNDAFEIDDFFDARDAQTRGVTARYRQDASKRSLVVRGARTLARSRALGDGFATSAATRAFPSRGLTTSARRARQSEWRGLGVQQSRGWVHYAIHRPEPHIMLYRRAKEEGATEGANC